MTESLSGQSSARRPAGPTSRSKLVALSCWLIAVLLTITAPRAWAAQCSLSVQGASFGSYDTFSNQSLDSTGNIGVSCDISTAYSVSLSAGGGSYASRSMASGTRKLNYNLYTDATRSIIWGDGTGGTATVSGSATSANHTVYGRIPARQNAYVGSYSDTIIVTLSF